MNSRLALLLAGPLLVSDLRAQELNEIYLSHVGADDQEFIELRMSPGSDLSGMMILIVDGDAIQAGQLDLAFDLTGWTTPEDGYFVAGNSGVAEVDLIIGPSKVLENGSQTLYLVHTTDVAAILARVGTDMDSDGDLITDIAGLATILDSVAVVDDVPGSTSAQVYDGSLALGPDGTVAPAGIVRCGTWCSSFLDHEDERNTDLPRTPGRSNVDARGKLGGGEDNDFASVFGSSVLLTGNLAIVGARNARAVHVFDRSSGALVHRLAPTTPGGSFGSALAAEGQTLVVGSPSLSGGQIFLYDLLSGNQLAQLTDPTGTSNNLGTTLAIEGGLVLAGAPDPGGTTVGRALVFDASTGSLLHTLLSPTPTITDSFGTSVALTGGTAVIGAPTESTVAPEAGAVHAYDVNSALHIGTWTATDAQAGARFGSSVAAEGALAVIGSAGHSTVAPLSGAAYVFSIASGIQLSRFLPQTASTSDGIGSLPLSVDIRGGTALVGAPGVDSLASDAGAAYLFDALSGEELARLVPTFGLEGDGFGSSVHLGDSHLLVGAPLDDGVFEDMGSAYVFQRGVGSSYCLASPNSTGERASIWAMGSNSIAINDLSLAAGPVPPLQTGLFFYGPNATQAPFGAGLLCVGGLPQSRLDLQPTTGGGLLVHPLDNTRPPTAAGQITVGSTWFFQAWFRDPLAALVPFGLSNGLEVAFVP